MYKTQRISVSEEFQDVFSHFYFAENKSGESIRKTLVPSYQTLMIFSFGSKVTLMTQQNTEMAVGKYVIFGPVKQAFDYILYPESAILVLNLKEDAFYRYFGTSSLIENSLINPDELIEGDSFASLWNELDEMEDVESQVNRILEFGKLYLRDRNVIMEQISNVCDEKLNPVKTIAEINNLSERTIQLNYKKQLGYSAKEFSRYKRFIKALRAIQEKISDKAEVDWFEIITECGYYDQSQLIHDFRQYMNLTPKQYLKFAKDICNPLT